MPFDVPVVRKKITRRLVLGNAAAMAVAPALAQECRIGPPPHEKGPRVWMDMDQVELRGARADEARARVTVKFTFARIGAGEMIVA